MDFSIKVLMNIEVNNIRYYIKSSEQILQMFKTKYYAVKGKIVFLRLTSLRNKKKMLYSLNMTSFHLSKLTF